jgi:arsenical pump membrane protein
VNDGAALAVALIGLGAVLITAVRRPRGLPEAVVAVPVAVVLVLTHVVTADAAWAEVRRSPACGAHCALSVPAERRQAQTDQWNGVTRSSEEPSFGHGGR